MMGKGYLKLVETRSMQKKKKAILICRKRSNKTRDQIKGKEPDLMLSNKDKNLSTDFLMDS